MSIEFSCCTFGYRRGAPVLRDLDLVLPPGRSVLLGPNGAGKSTLLGLGAGVLRPRSGRVARGGSDAWRRRERRRFLREVGWLPQAVRPTPGLRVREHVAYAGWLKGMSRADAWQAAAGALARVGLADHADRPARALSGGQTRRMGIAQCLVHDAKVLLLDEPTAGLDPAQRASFATTLLGLGDEVSVLVSTHQTEDLSDTYEHVFLIDAGSLIARGTTAEFLARARPDALPGRRAESAYTELMGGRC